MMRLMAVLIFLLAPALTQAATISGGGSGGGASAAGGANAVQGTDGAGALTDTGCTGTGSAITCTNGFTAGSGGTIGKVDFLEGTAPGAAGTAFHHNIYINSSNSTLESHENGGSAKIYGYAAASMTAGRCVQVAAGGGTQIEAASAACGAGGTAGSPLFVQTASATAVTAAAETTILGTGVGSLTIPVNWFTAAGTVMDVRFSGKYSTGAVPGTLQLKLKFGSTVVAQTAAFTPIVSVTDGVYSGFIRLVARTVGGTGTIFVADGIFTTGSTITPGEVIFANPTLGTAVTIDTTATQTVDLTATWGTGATNSITGYTFEMVGPGSAVSSVFGQTGAVTTLDVTSGSNTLTFYTRFGGDLVGVSGGTAGHIWNEDPLSTACTPLAVTGTNQTYGACTFPDSDGEYGRQLDWMVPAGGITSLTADIWWKTTGTGNARFRVQTICYASDAAGDSAYSNSTYVTAAAGTSGRLNLVNTGAVTITGCDPNERMAIRFSRNRTEASDTLNAALDVQRVVFNPLVSQ